MVFGINIPKAGRRIWDLSYPTRRFASQRRSSGCGGQDSVAGLVMVPIIAKEGNLRMAGQVLLRQLPLIKRALASTELSGLGLGSEQFLLACLSLAHYWHTFGETAHR